jgi:four helix bundle protein
MGKRDQASRTAGPRRPLQRRDGAHAPSFHRPCMLSPNFCQPGAQMGQSFRELVVWQRAIELNLTVYRLTSRFPSSERFCLTDQLRRAAISVPSNIAEGYGRLTRGEYAQFLGHARGSLCEIQTQIVIAGALDYGTEELRLKADSLCADVSRLLNALIDRLRKP